MTTLKIQFLLSISVVLLFACSQEKPAAENHNAASALVKGQSAVVDDVSERNVVQIAVSSADHSTLVKAVSAAGLVDALSNAGPFTVFAPVNAAFEKLPAGTLENLMKPANADDLENILQYHVYVGVIRENMMQDGMTLNQVNGKNVKISKSEGKIQVNGANVLGAVKASNGIVYVVDQVLIPEN